MKSKSLLTFLFLAGGLFEQPTLTPDLTKNPAPVRTALNLKLPTLFIAGDSTGS